MSLGKFTRDELIAKRDRLVEQIRYTYVGLGKGDTLVVLLGRGLTRGTIPEEFEGCRVEVHTTGGGLAIFYTDLSTKTFGDLPDFYQASLVMPWLSHFGSVKSSLRRIALESGVDIEVESEFNLLARTVSFRVTGTGNNVLRFRRLLACNF